MKEANRNSKAPKFIRRIEMVQKKSIMYYQQQQSYLFLKIVVALPTMVTSCRGILDRGVQIDGLGIKSFMTYESNVLFALRFMIDCNIVGGNWIEVPAGKYKKTAKHLSYCQLEFDCLYPYRCEEHLYFTCNFFLSLFTLYRNVTVAARLQVL
ncbi:DNA polymerase delta catalytic subunit-like [Humulus lupulus]|uniref:DNA polymerase delta catalytic subunit-like n=1 Tax=Humulus lupulus TaxID=3486 RepID=UPI002B40B9C7|nr:DNA polymerase delta catalytic subunit-like [Humulus lupulus]